MKGCCRRASSGLGEARHAEIDSAGTTLRDQIHLGELLPGTVEAHAQALRFAEPALRFGFGDAFDEVVADLDQP